MLSHLVTWFLAVQVLGLIAFPLAFLLFSRLPDRGYTFAKPLALVLVSYVLWMLGLTGLVPNTRLTIVAIVLALGLVSLWLFIKNRDAILSFLRSEWKMVLAAEAVFVGFFLVWVAIVSDIPAINHTEKPMDFGFMNAILQSRYFPPEDPWLAGHSISYYYFGHFMMAGLTKLTAVPSPVGYTLAVTVVPALTAMGVFGLVSNLVRLSGGGRPSGVGFGLVAAFLLILVGNLEGVLELASSLGWGGTGFWQWVGIKGLEGANAATPTLFPEQPWWWWRATRVIDTLAGGQSLDYTITEFPFFSFVLGDLHAHVVSLPFMIMVLGLGLNLFQSQDKLGLGWVVRHPVESAAVTLLAGSLAFINAWDFPILIAILTVIVLARIYSQLNFFSLRSFPHALLDTALMMLPIAAAAVVLFLPFYQGLSTQASGILPVTGPGTRPFLFLLVIGLFSLLSLGFLAAQIPGVKSPNIKDMPAIGFIAVVAIAPLLLWVITVSVLGVLVDALSLGWSGILGRVLVVVPGLAIAGLAGFSALQRVRHGTNATSAYPLLLMAIAFYLLVGAELFFLLDFFGNRMNTVFKVYFQAWVLLAIVGAYGLYYWLFIWKASSRVFKAVKYSGVAAVAVLGAASLYYPVGATIERTGLTKAGYSFSDKTLDGLAFLERSDPGEYAAITWLREEAPPGRIVEAVGNDYTDHARISSSTGFPTLLGWPGHELQWRGSSEAFEGRAEDVAAIYTAHDPTEAASLLRQYDVRYVYVGRRERHTYGGQGLTDFSAFLKTVWESDGVVIYEVTR